MSSSSLLPAALQKNLQQIVDRSNQSGASIQAILLSTTEGVPLGRVVVTTAVNEEVLATIESVWAPAAKQFPVLGLEKVKQVTAMYDHGTLVHVYQGPMVVTILAGVHCNLGAIRCTAIPLLKSVLEPLGTTLVNSLNPNDEEEETTTTTTYYQ